MLRATQLTGQIAGVLGQFALDAGGVSNRADDVHEAHLIS